MSFGERLKEARILRGLTQKQLAERLNIGSTTVTGYEKDNSEPNMVTINKIMEILKIDANFLFQDEATELYKNEASPEEFENIVKKYRFLKTYSPNGLNVVDMVLNSEYNLAKQLKEQSEYIQVLENANIENKPSVIDTRLINYYYRVASAGTGQIIFDMPPTKRIEIPNIPEYKKADYAIGVNGNSMEPTYHDGDTLLIEMADEIAVGEIGIFIVDGASYVKKLGDGELISLNPEFENVPLTENSRCMGRVLGKLEI